MKDGVAKAGPAQQPVGPRAWLYENNSGARVLHTNTALVRFEADMRTAAEFPDAHSMTPLYDQSALDAAVAASRGAESVKDCRLCDHYRPCGWTPQCFAPVACVDGAGFTKSAAPVQLWGASKPAEV